MVCRFLCSKPQDDDFGMDEAGNLDDILAQLHVVVKECFPAVAGHSCLQTIVVPAFAEVKGKGKSKVQAKAAPMPSNPETGATAAAGMVMMQLSEMDAAGNRTGALDRLHDNAMDIGSKVSHRRLKGTYEIAEVVESGAGAAIKLKLSQKRISMGQLWVASWFKI